LCRNFLIVVNKGGRFDFVADFDPDCSGKIKKYFNFVGYRCHLQSVELDT
jgi:hypothetical protein